MEIPPMERARIIRIAASVRKEYRGAAQDCDYRGFCQPISSLISQKLEEAGIEHVLVNGTFYVPRKGSKSSPVGNRMIPHFWIEFPQYDNAILDATAQQFGDFPPVWFPADPKYYSPQTDRTYIGSRYVEAYGTTGRPIRAYRRSK